MTSISVCARILEWAEIKPSSLAISMGDTSLSYSELSQRIESVAANARSAGLLRHEVVLLFMPQGLDAVICFFGLMRAGLIPSFMPLPSPKQEASRYWTAHASLLELIRPAAVVAPESQLADMQAAGLDQYVTQFFPAPKLLATTTFSASAHEPHEDDIALLQHSSGTTALKKGVALSHRAITAQVMAYAAAIEASENDVVVSWLPIYHDMGLIACTVMPLMLGQHVVMLDPFAWVSDPKTLFASITRYRGTLCWLPNFAFELLSKTVKPDTCFDLSSMRAFIDCSEPCKARSFDGFHKQFGSIGLAQTATQVCYAMAETVFGVSQTTLKTRPTVISVSPAGLGTRGRVESPRNDETPLQLLSAGKAIDGIDVSIVDGDGNPLPENCVGEIELSGKFLFNGYYKREVLTAEKFRNNRYRSNDLGFMHGGELYVLGRNDDLIIVHGRNYFAHEIEAVVNSISGLKPGRNVAIPVVNELLASQEVVLIAETESDAEVDLIALKREVKGQVMQAMGLDLRDVSIVPQGWLLKTSSGKISRSANKDKYCGPEMAGGMK